MAYKVFELLILLTICVSSICSMDVCEDQLNGAQLLHPLDCSKYIVCRFGTTYRIETCDGGRHFNRLTAECADPFEAACDIYLIKEQFVLSNECNTCRSVCGSSSQTQCSTSSSSTAGLSTHFTTTSLNPTSPALEPSSSTTPSPDTSSSSASSPETTDQSSSTPVTSSSETTDQSSSTPVTSSSETTDQSSSTPVTSSSETTDQSSSTPAPSSETTVDSHVSSGFTETTPHISSETTSITSPEATETTPNTSSSNASVTPPLDTSSEVTVTTSPAENSSPTPHIPSPSTTDAATTSPNTPSPNISSSISPGSTTASSNSVSTTRKTTGIPINPETPTSACTNNLKICVGKPNFSIIYVPGSCREYAVCIAGCANVISCPNNLLYDLENHICTYPQNVKCPYEVTPPTGPSAGPSGTKCENHGKCENQPDGALFADDSTGGYIVCQCECEVARPCPGGLVFNQESKVCDFPVIS